MNLIMERCQARRHTTSGHKMQSCIHRVVPFDPTEHRYSIAYFLRAEDSTMFTDSEGRYITAGQWHDEKFFAFTNPPELLADVPPSMILGGMKEEEDQEEAEEDEKAASSTSSSDDDDDEKRPPPKKSKPESKSDSKEKKRKTKA